MQVNPSASKDWQTSFSQASWRWRTLNIKLLAFDPCTQALHELTLARHANTFKQKYSALHPLTEPELLCFLSHRPRPRESSHVFRPNNLAASRPGTVWRFKLCLKVVVCNEGLRRHFWTSLVHATLVKSLQTNVYVDLYQICALMNARIYTLLWRACNWFGKGYVHRQS